MILVSMSSPTSSPLKVFVVEDSMLVRKRLAERIQPPAGAGLIVGEAEDVEAALRGIAAKEPDVVIVDLRLTDSHGIDLLHALRDRTDPIVTIYASDVFREASAAAGADYFFDKTTEFDRAMETIARLAQEKNEDAAG
jgi:two-component system response regulator DevR